MTQRQPKQHSYVRKFRIGAAAKVVGVAAAILSLNGCLLTSPYWHQAFADHTSPIPIQAFTWDRVTPVRFECAQASHGGVYPNEAGASWVLVSNVTPQPQPLLDPRGDRIYGASEFSALPGACWRRDPVFTTEVWYTAIRASQGSGDRLIKFSTFNRVGLECLGRETGRQASWFRALGAGCAATYSGSSTAIPYVIIRARA